MKNTSILVFLCLLSIITALLYLLVEQKDVMKILAESHQQLEDWLKNPTD